MALKITKYVLVIMLIFTVTKSEAMEIDLLWEARAIKAGKNLKELNESYNKKDENLKLEYEIMLESAFAFFLLDPEIVIKKTDKMKAFHIILNFGKKEGLLDVVYTYDILTDELLGVRIDRLPKGKAVVINNNPQIPNYFVITDPAGERGPLILFDKTDPFSTRVLSQ